MMKKTFLLTVSLIILPLALFAADRIVVLEIFTGTWCTYCPGAAMGADDLAEEYPGQVLVVEYHSGDVFENLEASSRRSFYGNVVRGFPTAIFDGKDTIIGGFPDQSMFPYYDQRFKIRRLKDAPLEIALHELAGGLHSTTGTLQAIITNTSDESVTGKVHFTVTESHIPYSWKGLEYVDFVERTMLPDPFGATITLAAGADTTITREYTIDDTWPHFTEDENIEFGCFFQDTTSLGLLREILQSAVIKFGDTLIEAVGETRNLPFSVKTPTVIGMDGSVELSLDAPVGVDISLYNSVGRKLATLHKGVLDAGAHRIEIKTDALPAGTYFIRVTAGVYNKIGKLLILH